MNQQKTGEFLKDLRKSKGMTQEQLAERFYVSSRTVSRWETGANMPDLGTLIDLADFYNVDIREIIDGERKSETMDNEIKDTLEKAAEYATEEKRKISKKWVKTLAVAVIVLTCSSVLFGKESKGLLNGIIPEQICAAVMTVVLCAAMILLIFCYLYYFGVFKKIGQQKNKRSKNK